MSVQIDLLEPVSAEQLEFDRLRLEVDALFNDAIVNLHPEDDHISTKGSCHWFWCESMPYYCSNDVPALRNWAPQYWTFSNVSHRLRKYCEELCWWLRANGYDNNVIEVH